MKGALEGAKLLNFTHNLLRATQLGGWHNIFSTESSSCNTSDATVIISSLGELKSLMCIKHRTVRSTDANYWFPEFIPFYVHLRICFARVHRCDVMHLHIYVCMRDYGSTCQSESFNLMQLKTTIPNL